jgi:hypothetical protein
MVFPEKSMVRGYPCFIALFWNKGFIGMLKGAYQKKILNKNAQHRRCLIQKIICLAITQRASTHFAAPKANQPFAGAGQYKPYGWGWGCKGFTTEPLTGGGAGT